MWIGRGQFARDLARWREAGWVTPDGEQKIAAEIASRRRGPGLAGALGILGVVLLGFAVMSFVAANWQDMSRLLRLAIIFAGLLGSYAAAAVLFKRDLDVFAHAAILLGVAIFGAGIMLIAQMYHIEGRPPDAVLVWALGALGAGILLRSRASLAAAAPLFALWSGWESVLLHAPHLPLLVAAAVLGAAFFAERWRPGLHITAALVTGWVIWIGYIDSPMPREQAHWITAAIGLASAGVFLWLLHRAPHVDVSGASEFGASLFGVSVETVASPLLGYAALAAFAGLFAMQFVQDPSTATLALLAAVTLALLLAMIVYGLRTGQRHLVWLGYCGFSAEILALYFQTVGSLLGSSLFFLIAGVIVIALAALAWRLHGLEERRMGALP